MLGYCLSVIGSKAGQRPAYAEHQKPKAEHACCKHSALLWQELQAQLESSHKSEEAAHAELQTQLNNHRAVCDELSSVQAERDSALQTAAEMEKVNATVTSVSVHSLVLFLFDETQNNIQRAAASSAVAPRRC